MRIFKKYVDQTSKNISSRMCIYEGCTARAIFGLTSGAFIAGFLKYMGASDSISGKIIALPVLATMLQFVSPIFIEKMNWKKQMITLGASLHRFMLVFMLFIPILPISRDAKLWTAAVIYLISYMGISFVSPAVSNMYASFIPITVRGSFFGLRERNIIIFSTIVTIAMGKILDIFGNAQNQYGGYIVLFVIVFINAILNTFSFKIMREVRIKPSQNKYKLIDVFRIPLRDKAFRKIIVLFFILSAGLQFGASYFGVYMVSRLELSYTFITLCSFISAVFYLIFTRIWGRFGDKNGWSKTTMLTLSILGTAHLLWFFVFDSWHILILIPFLHVLGGIAWAGINIALFNIQFDYSPKEGRTLYLGFNAAFSGIIGFSSALLSSWIVGINEKWSTIILGMPINVIQIILSLSGVMILITSLYIRRSITDRKITTMS